MKKILAVLLLAVLFNCKSKVDNESKTIEISSSSLNEMVTYLASDNLLGRKVGTEGIDQAATYIENKFKAFGVKPYFETYKDHFKAKDLDAYNVVGYIEGNDPELKNEVIILGAHYDHIGYSKAVETDSIANGANDNAAGVSAVLALAEYFAVKKNNKRSLMFTLYSAEEMGLLGAKALAEKLKAQNLDLYTMVNFEMIGVPLIDKPYTAFLTGFELSNMAEKMNVYAGNPNLLGSSEVAVKYQLFKRSDNYAFYEQFKVPSHTVSSCDLTNFGHYHKPGDETELMNFEFMKDLVKALVPAIETMSNTPTKEIVMYEQE